MITIWLLMMLFLFAITEQLEPKSNKSLLFVSVVILSVFLFFRYGQGVDYFNYVYAIKSSSNAIEYFFRTGEYFNRFEVGFSFLSYFFLNKLGFSTEFFISTISLIAIIPYTLFLKRYSIKPLHSLLYFYSFFFFIYSYSAIRQGMTIGLFYLFLLPAYYDGKILKYYVGVFVLFLLHNSALLLCLLPLVKYIRLTQRHIAFYLSLSFILGIFIIVLAVRGILGIFGVIGEVVLIYLEEEGGGLDVISLILRLAIYALIATAYFRAEKKRVIGDVDKLLFGIYTLSLILYLLFSFSSLLSSRMSAYFRLVEPVLVGNFLLTSLKSQYFLFKRGVVYGLCVIMYVKSIKSEIDLGEYKDNVTLTTFPYISIFEKETVYKHRDISTKIERYVD